MRKISTMFFVLILMAFALNLDAQINQDWKWIHPGPQGNTLRWVKMMDSTNWLAVGYAGTFMKSSNSGASWTIYTNAGGWQSSFNGQGRILYSGWFFNLNTGLVCGSSGWIARTTNAGLNWDSIASPTANALYGLHFINSTTGYSGGASGTVLKTTDAGLTWTVLTTGITTTIYNIFAGNNFVLAPTTVGNVRYSTDAGTTWATSYTGSSYTVYDVNFIDLNTGMTCGTSGITKATTNGGLNWTAGTIPSTSTKYELLSTVTSSPPSTPYSEGFESTTFPPTGWQAVSVLGASTWLRSTAQFHSGAASAFITYESSGGDDWLITPKWTMASGDSLVFWWKNAFSSAYPPDSIQIRVSTTDSNIASFTNVILRIDGATTPYTWTRYAVSLNTFAGQNIYIAFRQNNTDGNGGFLDDVSVNRPAQNTPSFFVVGDSYGIYKTDNLGVNWTLLTYNDPVAPWTSTHYTLDVLGNRVFAGGANGLMQKSVNSGTNFTCLTNWLSPGTKYDVWAQYNNGLVIVVGAPGIAGTTFDQVLRSTNGGTTWTVPVQNSFATFYSIAMINANTGFMAGSLGALRKTTNGGVNWDSVAAPFGTSIIRRLEFVNANTGYAFQGSAALNGGWKTTNGGTSWDSLTNMGSETRGYASSFVNANTGYIGNYTPKLMKTTNGGANWTLLANTPMGGGFIYGVNFFNPDSGYACGTAAGRLCRTTNGGTTFDTVPQPFASSLYTMKWFKFNSGWIFGSNGFAGRTTTGGASWLIYNTSGSIGYGNYMTNADSGFVVGTSGYIHKISKQPLTGTEWSGTEIPTTYYLKQNYPNPFNPTTTIEFAIPKTGLVSLKMYDIAGREVLNAINMTLNPGIVKYTFNGTTFASGVYFYRLAVDGKQIDTKKMVLVK